MRFVSLVVLALLSVSRVGAAEEAARQGDVYPLDHCIVSGEKLDARGEPVTRVYDGREIRFCCEGCTQSFEVDKEKFLKKLDEEIIARQKEDYPLTTCLVMPEDEIDEKLDFVYNNRLIRVCCRDCIKDLKAEPAKFLPVLDQAVIEKQKAGYPTDACVVCDQKLDDATAVDYITGNRLVRLCKQECVAEFEKNPAAHLQKLDAAKKP